MGSHKDLIVWQKAVVFADMIYEATDLFPKNQMFSLAQQLQRSAVSISSNIAEGSSRNSTKEFIQFLHIARGSLAEADTQLMISKNRKYIADENYNTINKLADEIGKMLTKLIHSLKNKSGI